MQNILLISVQLDNAVSITQRCTWENITACSSFSFI